MSLISSAKSLIDSCKVVSFDIFDTLLVRPYIKPTDLFVHLERLHGTEGFAQHRVQSELNARKRYSMQEDVTIDQIYEMVCEEFKGLQQIEIEFEAQVLRANKVVKELYDYAVEQKKMVIIASDMYLSAEIMTPILTKCGYCSHHKPLMYNWYGNIADCDYAYKLFGVIPICHRTKYNYKEKIFLFRYLPIWKIKRESNSVSHYLLGFIPILKFKRE